MNTQNLSTLKIHKLSQEQYDRELAAGRLEENAIYLTPDERNENWATTETLKGILSANSWSNEPPFTQFINIPGLLFEDYPIVDIDLSEVDDVQSVIEGWNFVGRMTVPADNTAIAYCYGEKPTVNIPLIFKVVR